MSICTAIYSYNLKLKEYLLRFALAIQRVGGEVTKVELEIRTTRLARGGARTRAFKVSRPSLFMASYYLQSKFLNSVFTVTSLYA